MSDIVFLRALHRSKGIYLSGIFKTMLTTKGEVYQVPEADAQPAIEAGLFEAVEAGSFERYFIPHSTSPKTGGGDFIWREQSAAAISSEEE